MRQFLSKLTWHTHRWLITLLVGLYFVLGLFLLAGRYWVAPHIDNWRPQIAQRLSHMLGETVTLGSVQISWQGWRPQFNLRDIQILAQDGRLLMSVPRVDAQLDWTALLPGHTGALRLLVQGMDLDVARTHIGQLQVLGQSFSLDSTERTGQVPTWLGWVLAQPRIEFRDLGITWRDQLRAAPELHLSDVHALLRQQEGGLGISLSAKAPEVGEGQLAIRAQLADAQALSKGYAGSTWRSWLQLSDVSVDRWRQWLEIPSAMQQGQMDAQIWVQSAPDGPRLTALLGVQGFRWQAGARDTFNVPQAQAWLQGRLGQWQALSRGQNAGPAGLAFDVRSQGTYLVQPDWFDAPLALGVLAARGSVRHDTAWSVQIDQFNWQNNDITMQAAGNWAQRGLAGLADFKGTIQQARLNAIHRYLPREVNEDARTWLARGLQAGVLKQGHWLLKGDLSRFPFGDQPDAGDFQVAGNFQGAQIEFVPDAPKDRAWPLLHLAEGAVDLRRMDLQLQASTATMQPEPDKTIHLSGLRARIPDLENDATLTVSGHTEADGDVYMDLIQHSPLSRMLDEVFDEATATGQWKMPLSLKIPLLHVDDSRVQGRIDVDQASLQFLPQAPVFEHLSGQIHFNEHGVQLAQPLKGRLLGGALTVQGTLQGGHEAQDGLHFQGHVTAGALAKFVGVPGMQRLSGKLAYRAQLRREKSDYTLQLDSDTQGLALDFPAPLAKPASQPRSLHVRWTDADPHDDMLEVRLGDAVRVQMRHRRNQRQGPYFQQVLVGVGEAADDQMPGMRIAFKHPLLDLDLWNRIVDEFSIPRRGRSAAKAGPRPLWPDLSLLAVQAEQLRLFSTRLDQAVLRVTRTPEDQWSMNLRSKQTAGTVKWRELDGRVQGAVSARFARLSLGDDARDKSSLLPDVQDTEDQPLDNDFEIPGLVLQADEFLLYGRSLGALRLDGVREEAGKAWRLKRLQIGNENAQLKGTGMWRLRGADHGLHLKALVKTQDLGAWLDAAGWPGLLAGGQGTLDGQFFWRNLPWRKDKADLQGVVQVSLDKGRLLSVGSKSAKLLELLSLQSIMRLNRLDQGLTGLPKDGFPFDSLRGTLRLDGGVARIQDYKVIGPAGTALLDGHTNIINESLDLQAVVVPNLDVSGAALAAGIAINPLVGLGAFITQWLLKTPLAKAMTVRYHVTGTWDDLVIKETPVNATAQSSDAGSSPSPKSP